MAAFEVPARTSFALFEVVREMVSEIGTRYILHSTRSRGYVKRNIYVTHMACGSIVCGSCKEYNRCAHAEFVRGL